MKASTLIIGIKSEVLFPIEEQKRWANSFANAQYLEIDLFYGHDGVLIETKTTDRAIQDFLNKQTHHKK